MIKENLAKLGISTAYNYLEKDPEKNFPKLLGWVDRYAEKRGDIFKPHSCREY